jgi:biopolymer transport protein ExbB
MQADYIVDNLKFISEGGAVSIIVATGLLAMSIGSWTLMVIKAIQARRLKSSSATFLTRFWQASASACSSDSASDQQSPYPSFITSIAATVNEDSKTLENPFSRLASQGISAAVHHHRYTSKQEHPRHDEFIAQALRRSISQESMRLENGLTLLASVGSIAPFIGLFGTVWGIYHALGTIAVGGQATVDKVAGPVGEALIMTAFGLAVAIPAVLAYNTLVRDNRLLMGEMETFAHDLHTYLTTGVPLATGQITELVSTEVLL